jgi:WD40 repeat protein
MMMTMMIIIYYIDNNCYNDDHRHPILCPFTGTDDKTISVYDTSSHQMVAMLKSGHRGHVNAVAFDGSGRYIASGGRDV